MALGTSRPRSGDGKEGRRREKNLDAHYALMQKYISQGMAQDEASRKAYEELFGGVK